MGSCIAVRWGLNPTASPWAASTREPTFSAFWNNTDYWFDETSWQPHNATYPNDSAEYFQVCAGSSPPNLVFDCQGAPGAPAMNDPVVSSNHPGVVRIGIIFAPPESPGQLKIVRATPVAFVVAGEPQIPVRSAFNVGDFQQANVENVASATLASLSTNCNAGLPVIAQYWCADPVQRRRGQIQGDPAAPLYLEPLGGGNAPPDVDAVPLPTVAGIVPLATGTISFDTTTTLQSCPTQPSSVLQPVDAHHTRVIELQEEAVGLGVSPE